MDHLITCLRDKLGEWSVCLGAVGINNAPDWSEPLWIDFQYENMKFLRRHGQCDVTVVQIGRNIVESHIGVVIEAWAVDSVYWHGDPSENRTDRTILPRFADTKVEFEATISITFECDSWSNECSIGEIIDIDLVDLDSIDVGSDWLGYKIRTVVRGM